MRERYRTIVADPPWEYDQFARGGSNGTISTTPLPYPSMCLEEMADIPVRSWQDKSAGCFLWMWTTNKYLPDAFALAGIWGFHYRQTLVWRKTGAVVPFGGSVSPNHAEYLLLCRVGPVRFLRRLDTNVIDAPAQQTHSKKPEMFLDLIESVSPGPRLEMFARRARLGWDVWGNEVDSHVEAVS